MRDAQLKFVELAAAALERARDRRPQRIPGVGPGIGGGHARPVGAGRRQQCAAGVVGDQRQRVAPGKPHRRGRVEDQHGGQAQCRRPVARFAQRRIAPLSFADAGLAHYSCIHRSMQVVTIRPGWTALEMVQEGSGVVAPRTAQPYAERRSTRTR